MRKLATIEKILNLEPIEGADFIELATVRGWQLVVKKGEFEVGDECVYFEIDSFLPIEPRYEFLRKSSYKKFPDGSGEGFRLKTMRFKGQISQGLALPVDNFPELKNCDDDRVTELLNVKLYEPPIPAQLQGKIKGAFPSFITKTHQERIQNVPEYLDKYKDEEFEVTVKLDGTSMTVYYNNGEFGVCGHKWEHKEAEHPAGNNTYWKVANELNLREILTKHGHNIALQGELIGPGIQGNPEKLSKHEFRIFDIYDIDRCNYTTRDEREIVLDFLLPSLFCRLRQVPLVILDFCFDKLGCKTMSDILCIAESPLLRGEVPEGLVFKSRRHINGQIVSFKVINNKYLLKN